MEDLQETQEKAVQSKDTSSSELRAKLTEHMTRAKQLEIQLASKSQALEEAESRCSTAEDKTRSLELALERKDEEMKAVEDRYKKYLEKAKNVSTNEGSGVTVIAGGKLNRTETVSCAVQTGSISKACVRDASSHTCTCIVRSLGTMTECKTVSRLSQTDVVKNRVDKCVSVGSEMFGVESVGTNNGQPSVSWRRMSVLCIDCGTDPVPELNNQEFHAFSSKIELAGSSGVSYQCKEQSVEDPPRVEIMRLVQNFNKGITKSFEKENLKRSEQQNNCAAQIVVCEDVPDSSPTSVSTKGENSRGSRNNNIPPTSLSQNGAFKDNNTAKTGESSRSSRNNDTMPTSSQNSACKNNNSGKTGESSGSSRNNDIPPTSSANSAFTDNTAKAEESSGSPRNNDNTREATRSRNPELKCQVMDDWYRPALERSSPTRTHSTPNLLHHQATQRLEALEAELEQACFLLTQREQELKTLERQYKHHVELRIMGLEQSHKEQLKTRDKAHTKKVSDLQAEIKKKEEGKQEMLADFERYLRRIQKNARANAGAGTLLEMLLRR